MAKDGYTDLYTSYNNLVATTTNTILTNSTYPTFTAPSYNPYYVQPNYIQPQAMWQPGVIEGAAKPKKKEPNLDDPVQWLEHRVQEMLWYE